MAQKETGEQKLLRIIESQQKPEGTEQAADATSPAAAVAAASVKSLGLPSMGLPPVFSQVLDLFKGKTAVGGSKEAFGLKQINMVLGVLVVIVLFIFFMTLANGIGANQKRVSIKVDSKIAATPANWTITYPSPSQYLDVIKTRNIFQPFEKKIVEQASTPLEEKKISTLTKDLKLVGISWLDSPESASVMFEDTTTGVTHFLKKGEAIHEMTIKAIYADSVVLSYQGEELLLRL